MKQTRSQRERQGLEIAALVKLTTNGMLWRVPSQATDRLYTVNPTQGTCSCTDHGTRKVKCKHLYAVEFTILREAEALGPPAARSAKKKPAGRSTGTTPGCRC